MSQATDMLQAYIAAETKILAGQSVSMSGRMLTRADLGEVRAGRLEWQRVVDAEQRTAAGGGGPRYSVAGFSA